MLLEKRKSFFSRVIETEILGRSVHSIVRIPATISRLVQRIVLNIFGWSWGWGVWDGIVTDFKLICKYFPSKTEEDDEKGKSG